MRTTEEIVWACIFLIMLVIAVVYISGCALNKEEFRSRSDCELETPDGHVMRCNVHDRAKDNEGKVLTLP